MQQNWRSANNMTKTKLKMVYWKGEKFWFGKLLERPEIMTQAETLEELEENLKDAYYTMMSCCTSPLEI